MDFVDLAPLRVPAWSAEPALEPANHPTLVMDEPRHPVELEPPPTPAASLVIPPVGSIEQAPSGIDSDDSPSTPGVEEAAAASSTAEDPPGPALIQPVNGRIAM